MVDSEVTLIWSGNDDDNDDEIDIKIKSMLLLVDRCLPIVRKTLTTTEKDVPRLYLVVRHAGNV